MGKGHRRCEVCGVKEAWHTGHNLLFSKFPLEPNRCREWLKAVGNEELVHLPIEKLHEQRNVCASHFGKKDFNKKGNRLKRHAIPTLNLKALPLTEDQLAEFPQHIYRHSGSKDLMPEAVPSTSQQSSHILMELSQNEILPEAEPSTGQQSRQILAEQKRPCVDTTNRAGPSRSYAQVAKSPLCVAVTCGDTAYLAKEQAMQVLTLINKKIIKEAWTALLDQSGPEFMGKPLYSEGALKLWCANEITLAWLQGFVSGIALTPSVKLVVKKQSDIPRRIRCGIFIPDDGVGCLEEERDIGRVLAYQNRWLNITPWRMLSAVKQGQAWFVVVTIPEDQILVLLERGCRLSMGTGSVYVKFRWPNGRYERTPYGWDTTTAKAGTALTGSATAVAQPAPAPGVSAAPAKGSATQAATGSAAVPLRSRSPDDIILSSGSDSDRGEDETLDGGDEDATSDGVPFLVN